MKRRIRPATFPGARHLLMNQSPAAAQNGKAQNTVVIFVKIPSPTTQAAAIRRVRLDGVSVHSRPAAIRLINQKAVT